MLFNSIEFFILVLILFGLYYLPIVNKLQKLILVVGSFFFYAFHNYYLAFLLAYSLVVNTLIYHLLMENSVKVKRKKLMVIGVMANILILLLFKYKGLLYFDLVTDLANLTPVESFLWSLPLPIGISFYCLQAMTLCVDTYRKDIGGHKVLSKESSILNVLLYLSFFPQLIAGPIVKSKEFLWQIDQKYFREIKFKSAIQAIVLGYFLKMVIADNLAVILSDLDYPNFLNKSSLEIFSMLCGFSIQLFADFAGYSYIAIGIGHLFGYQLPKNFNRPFIARSLSEFWRRWHISLSTWIRDYIYIPLGGSRQSKNKNRLNLLLAMMISGLWHGASWMMLLWGGLHGLALIFEKKLKVSKRVLGIGKGIFIFIIVSLLWGVFKMNSLTATKQLYSMLFFNSNPTGDFFLLSAIFIYSFPVFIYHIYPITLTEELRSKISRFSYIGYALIVLVILSELANPGEFYYYRF